MIRFNEIGKIYTPFTDLKNMPIQPMGARGTLGEVRVKEEYEEGLLDIEGFSHIILIYNFNKSFDFKLSVKPFLDDKEHGLFATRAPRRPNAIGLSVVKLLSKEKNVLKIENIDVLNETPLLDIKPYVPAFNAEEDIRIGWLEGKVGNAKEMRSDERFL